MAKVSGKPDSIGQYLTIDLTRDILGVSSTGYVIRTSCASDEEAVWSRPCALKRIQAMDEEPPDLARLSHENVVQLMHYWTEERDLFLVMELMDGDLAMLMEEAKGAGASPFSMSVAVEIMLQIAKGMLHLHEMGVAHPQLKCENVLYKLSGNKTEAFEVGDVVVKLGGFGCSRPADRDSKSRDVLCFGLTCLEILTGDIGSSDIVSGAHIVPDRADGARSRIPESTPTILRECILSCLDTQFSTFLEVMTMLQRAESSVMQSCKDEMVFASESVHTKAVQTRTEDLSAMFISNTGLKEVLFEQRLLTKLYSGGTLGVFIKIFDVHQLHPQQGDVSTSIRATLIFFHGFHKAPEEWRRTWMTRDNKLVWPQKWLPEDLGAGNIRVLSISFDANCNVSNKYKRYELGKNLVQKLVLSPRWKLGELEKAIFLVGHSFGGMLIKSLVAEARNFVQNNIVQQEAMKCEMFLKSLAMIVFYSVPHAPVGLEFETYIAECRKSVALQRSSFLQSLQEDSRFIADMNKLSTDFESAVPEKIKILAFLEGKPMRKKRVLVTEESCGGQSRSWEFHKLDNDNHFEVCRPNSKNHTGYRILLDHLQQHMNNPSGMTFTAVDIFDSDVRSVLGKCQGDDLFKASEALPGKPPFGSSFNILEERPSRSGICSRTTAVSKIPSRDSNMIVPATSAPTTKPPTLPDFDSDTPSDQSREPVPAEVNLQQDEIVDYREEGGLQFRENLGKYVVEYRPPHFMWKLWMGTYATVEEAQRACDCARFYANQDKGEFYFDDSPSLFAELGPLNRAFTSVSKDVKDKAFNVEVKKRAKQVIRKLKNAQVSSDNVQLTSSQQLKPLHSDPTESLDPFEIDSQVQSWDEFKGSSSQWSFYASQVDQDH